MKQNITWKQLTELSFEQVNKLQKLVNQKYHFVKDTSHWEELKNYKKVFSDGTSYNIHTSYIGIVEKTTIGKMIEILTNHYSLGDIMIYDNEVYIIGIGGANCAVCFSENNCKCNHTELVDALWEAVKRTI